MLSHFFTNTIMKSYTNKINDLLKPNDLVILNLTNIYYFLIETQGNIASTSTRIGTRNTKKRNNDYVYADTDIDYYDPNDKYKGKGGIGTPLIQDLISTPNSILSFNKPHQSPKSQNKTKSQRRSTKRTKTRRQRIRFTVNTPPRETRIREIKNKQIFNLNELIHKLALTTCKGGIDYYYGKNAVKHGVYSSDIYDIAIIANSDIKREKSITNKLQDIYGMIVVQKGECIQYSDSYAINLICANKKDISKYLMGLFLFTIKKSKHISPFGLLETAGGYTNVEALCLYEKFGFKHNSHLIDNCFPSDIGHNLPMIVNMNDLSVEDIFAIIRDKTKLQKDAVCYVRGNIQDKIATYKKILYFFEQNPDYSYIYDFYNDYKQDIDDMYKELGITPDYRVRGLVDKNKIIQVVKPYIETLYLSVKTSIAK